MRGAGGFGLRSRGGVNGAVSGVWPRLGGAIRFGIFVGFPIAGAGGFFWGVGGAMGAGLCLNPILSFSQNFLKIVSVSLFDHSHTMFFVLDFMYHITCGE